MWSRVRRFGPVLLLLGGLFLLLAMGWHRFLTMERVAVHRELVQSAIAAHPALAALVYVSLYILVVAFSVPGGLALTLAGGLLFGTLAGGLMAVAGATIGATVVFVVARTVGTTLAERIVLVVARLTGWGTGRALAGLDRLRHGFQENALSYMLFLRLVPAFPFWLVNLAPALLGVELRTFVLGTAVGIIPGTFAFAAAGEGLDSIITAAEAAQAACIAQKGAASCPLALNAGAFLTPQLAIAFTLLGVVALLPAVLKKWSRRNG